MIKIHPVFYFLPGVLPGVLNLYPFLKSIRRLCTSQDGGPSHDSLIDRSVSAQTVLVSYLDLPWGAVISVFTAGADVDKNVS